jgi:hypothetical protein
MPFGKNSLDRNIFCLKLVEEEKMPENSYSFTQMGRAKKKEKKCWKYDDVLAGKRKNVTTFYTPAAAGWILSWSHFIWPTPERKRQQEQRECLVTGSWE